MNNKLFAISTTYNQLDNVINYYCYGTFFCLYLIANFRRFRLILSPCSKAGPFGSWLSIISSSYELRVWSSRAVAKSWHCFLNSCLEMDAQDQHKKHRRSLTFIILFKSRFLHLLEVIKFSLIHKIVLVM